MLSGPRPGSSPGPRAAPSSSTPMESLGRAWTEANVVGSDFPAVAPRPFRPGGGVSWKASSRAQPAALSPAVALALLPPFGVGKGEGPPPGPCAPALTPGPPRFPWEELVAAAHPSAPRSPAQPGVRGRGRAGGIGDRQGERVPSPPPFPRWVLGRQGASAGLSPARSLRRCFVCIQIPELGEGMGGRDGVLAGTLCFGVNRSPGSVSVRLAL